MPSRADWMNDLRRYLGLAVEWVFRKRSVGLRVMRCGAAFVLASLAGFTVSFRRGEDVLFFSSEAWLPLSIVVLFVGVVTLSLGLWLVLRMRTRSAPPGSAAACLSWSNAACRRGSPRL